MGRGMTITKRLGTYLFVKDIDSSLRFYERLGLEVEKVSDMFARAGLDGDTVLELGTADLTSSYDANYSEPPMCSKGTLNFELDAHERVDEKASEMAAAGYVVHLKPIDALWQARFAILLDPDGNQVGLHGPRDTAADRLREQGAG